MSNFKNEINKGERFEFGKNWSYFLNRIDDSIIERAQQSLTALLGLASLDGMTFLDLGSGSGLFSLAAYNLGAKVTSFDYDPSSVACTSKLREKYGNETRWEIFEGSALDNTLMPERVFDVVYSWGVLHHTGDMYSAFVNADRWTKKGGLLTIGIYNYHGFQTKYWTMVKRLYNKNIVFKTMIKAYYVPVFFMKSVILGLLLHGDPRIMFEQHSAKRGMSCYIDWIDWIGGYPYETASIRDIFVHFTRINYSLENINDEFRFDGINEFVFRKSK